MNTTSPTLNATSGICLGFLQFFIPIVAGAVIANALIAGVIVREDAFLLAALTVARFAIPFLRIPTGRHSLSR